MSKGNLGKALVLFFSIVAILHNVHNLAIDSDEYNKAHQMNNDFYGTIDETNPRRDDIEVENLSEENDDFGLDSDFESDIDSDLDNIGINKEDSEQLYDARRNKGKLKRGKEITFRLTKNLKKKGTPLEILKWIAKIVNKLSWKKYYKKVYPGKIRGPKSCNDRIAVVGAGPSGVHMAYLLKKKGFKNIKIYEETSRIGGKSKSINYRGAVHEMGTCYYAGGYEKIMELVEKFTTSKKIPAKLTYLWNSTTTESQPLDLEVYILQAVMAENPGITEMEAKMMLTVQMMRYLSLHVKIFGGVSRGQLPPKPKNMTYLRGHFLAFLKRNHMSDLHHLFVATQTLQGYGQLDEVPTLYGLMWNTPALIIGALRSFMGEHLSYGALSNGFQNLWEEIAKQNQLDIEFNSKVMNVDLGNPDSSKPIRVHVSKNAEEVQVHEYDFIVWAVNAKSSLWSFTGGDTKEERKLFEGMTHSYYSTSLVDEMGTKRSQAPEDWFFTNIKDSQSNIVWADRDSYGVLNQINGPAYEQGLNKTGDDDSPKRSMVIYQYSVSEQEPRTQELMEEIGKHFQAMGATSYLVVDQNKWSYFPRFNQTQTEEGNHWRVLDIQGNNNVWYIGSSTSFESVKSCVEYNLLLINRMEKPKREMFPDLDILNVLNEKEKLLNYITM